MQFNFASSIGSVQDELIFHESPINAVLLWCSLLTNDGMLMISPIRVLVNYFLYHNRVILVCLIFFCSWKMPYIRASEVGGPGPGVSALFLPLTKG